MLGLFMHVIKQSEAQLLSFLKGEEKDWSNHCDNSNF